MADIALKPAYARATVSGNSPRVEVFPEAATQSFVKGEPVYLVAGKVTECGDNPGVILGLAAKNATGVTDTPIPVEIAEPDTLFQMNIAADTSGSNLALTQAMLGFPSAILRDTTNGRLYCYGGVAANGRVVINKFIDAVGDTNARVLVRFLSNFFQLGSTS